LSACYNSNDVLYNRVNCVYVCTPCAVVSDDANYDGDDDNNNESCTCIEEVHRSEFVHITLIPLISV